MLSADGVAFSTLELDAHELLRAAPPAPPRPESISIGDEDQGILTGDLQLPFAPLEDTFKLHSLPEANHTIYIDFDGHRTSNTAWNTTILEGTDFEGADIDTPPFDIDGDPLSFSDEELTQIQEAFLWVAEDFAPFNVNVTTEEPTDLDDLRRTSIIDERWGVRVVVGGSTYDWLTPDDDLTDGEIPDGAGGVAFLNSFSDPIDTPAFAFCEAYSFTPSNPEVSTCSVGGDGGSAKNIAEVVSHEVGHTFGLSHDGQGPEPGWDPNNEDDPRGPVEYYPGQGVWAPIMGVAYSAPVSQWSQGEYFRANNQEDDLALIARDFHGVGFRPDDQAGFVLGDGTVFGATRLERLDPTTESILNNSVGYEASGVIEQNTDFDIYEFFSFQGEISIDALPAAVGPNLDIKLELRDESGNVVATAAPDNELPATLTTTVFVPGFYTVAVTGDASQADPQPISPSATDYTDYGSVGVYSLDIQAALGPEPDGYEKNDFLGEAYDAPYADYTFRGSLHQGGDEDFYKWTAGESGTLITDLRFIHADSDLELEIYDQNGVRIPGAISASNTDNEYLEVSVVANQSYFVRVWSRNTQVLDSYELWLDGPGIPLDGFTSLDGTIDLASQFEGGTPGAEVPSFEFTPVQLVSELGPVESNETPQTALALRPGPTTGGGSLSDYELDLSIHRPDDNDYLLWTSPDDGKLILDALFTHTDANIDVEVREANIDSNGVVVSTSPLAGGVGDSVTDNERVIVDVVAGEAYLIRVFATATAGTDPPGDALYTLLLDGPELSFDAFELNNSLAEASVSLDGATGITPGLSIHSPIDEDFFSWTAPATGDLRARAFFFHENGDLDLKLYNSAGDVLAASTSLTDNESVVQRVIGGETYFIHVYGFEGATQAAYALEVAFAAAPEIPGDYSGNGFVDALDQAIWASTYGASLANLPPGETELLADGNGDGFVDEADYVIWRDNEGAGTNPIAGALPDEVGKTAAPAPIPYASLANQPTVASDITVGGVDLLGGDEVGFSAATFVPLDDTFTLHSNPEADHTIYLDFDGHITANPEWDSQFTGLTPEDGAPPIRFGLPFATPAYDIDGDPENFSDQELLNIQEAFFRVAEDFAPFDVNVTTEEPPLADLQNAGGDDTRWGVRIVSGGSTFDWLTWPGSDTGAAGGVALLGSFASQYDTPAYAFNEGGIANAKNLAEVISHEAGHTLGLSHDGFFTLPDPDDIDPEEPPTEPNVEQYYLGHENGVWGPIMGAAYVPVISQWSIGEYFLANNDEDDLMIITSANGFGYREDDHGDGVDTATGLPTNFLTESYNATGLIEHSGDPIETGDSDRDYFSFFAGVGAVTINALPAALGPNLDIKLELFDSLGNLLATAAPDNDQTASISYQSLEETTYFVSVTGDAFVQNPSEFEIGFLGYSEYGSLGEYNLDIQVTLPEEPTPPDQFEVNDTLATPATLPQGDQQYNNLSRHVPDDDDVFLWTAGSDGPLLVDLLFSHDEGDLDLLVYRADDQTLLEASQSETDNESVSMQVFGGESYLIQVTSVDLVEIETYSLVIDGPGADPDQFEVNDTPETATVVATSSVDEILNFHFAGDEDYFQWLAPADDTLRVEALFNTSETDLKVELIERVAVVDEVTNEPTGEFTDTVVAQSVPATDGTGEVVATAATQGSLYLIRVYSDGAVAERQLGEYRLIVNGAPLTGDALEPNDLATPTVVVGTKVTFEGLSLNSATDTDYFTYTPPVTGVLTVAADFLQRFGDLDMRLTDSMGVIAEATTASNGETIVARVTSNETYTLEVFGYQNSLVTVYDLEFIFDPIPPTPGDFNDDGEVGPLDYFIWSRDFGMTGPDLAADGNDDGVVDLADYTLYRDNLGTLTLPVSGRAPLVITPPAVATDGVNAPTEAMAVVSDSAEPVVEERVTRDAGFAVPLRGGSLVSTPTVEREVAFGRALSADLALLLIENEVGDSGDEVSHGEEESHEEEPLDDAFAALGASFDSLN